MWPKHHDLHRIQLRCLTLLIACQTSRMPATQLLGADNGAAAVVATSLAFNITGIQYPNENFACVMVQPALQEILCKGSTCLHSHCIAPVALQTIDIAIRTVSDAHATGTCLHSELETSAS